MWKYQLITILAALLTLIGYLLNIYKKRICFWIWITGDFVWLLSCAIILNTGLILSNAVFLGVNFCGWLRWRKDDISEQRIIFVSMPYNAPTPDAIQANIEAAEKASIQLIKRGWAVYTPHKNTAGYERYEGEGIITTNTWYDGDLAILRRCDAIFMGLNWQKSPGAIGELQAARKWKKQIYFYTDGYPSPEGKQGILRARYVPKTRQYKNNGA